MSGQSNGVWKAFGQAGSVGITLAVCVFLGAGLGVWLDRLWHTQPWLMLVFMALGIVAGFYQIAKVLPGKKDKEPRS